MRISVAAETRTGPSHRLNGVGSQDAHAHTTEFEAEDKLTWATVLDGHGKSRAVADLGNERLRHHFFAAIRAGQLREKAMTTAFLAVDQEAKTLPGGACATALCLQPNKSRLSRGLLTLANVGDTETLLVTPETYHTLTVNHRAAGHHERRRILKAGGKVVSGYVEHLGHHLQIARALGDWDMRPAGVIPNPHVKTIPLPPLPFWIVVATDGIWDYVSKQAVAKRTRRYANPQKIARDIVELAHLTRRSHDDCTILVISGKAS